jgi:hypothetical protein
MIASAISDVPPALLPSLSIEPQVGICAGTPSPRKLKLASDIITIAMAKVAITVMLATVFGTTWRSRT